MTLPLLRSLARRIGWGGAILAIGIACTLGGFVAVRQAQERRAQARFDEVARRAEGRLLEFVRDTESLLNSMKGLAQAKGELKREQFREFIRAKGLDRWYPSLLGVAYSLPLERYGRAEIEQRLRLEHGDPSLNIHPGVGFGDDAIVLFEEPEATNRPAVGFNSASHPDQRRSIGEARDSGAMRATPPVTLAQAPRAGKGVVLRLPVYQGSFVPETVEARRLAIRGYANAVFLVDDLVRSAFADLEESGVRGRLTDLGDARPTPMAEGGGHLPRRWWHLLLPPDFSTKRRLEVGDRVWELELLASPGFRTFPEAGRPWGAGLLLLQTTLLISGLVASITRQGRASRELAERMTEEFQRSESRLHAITRVLPDLVLVIDQEGRYREVLGNESDLLRALPTELRECTVADVLPPDLAPRVMETIRKTLQEQRVQSLEYNLEVPRGLVRFEARVSPLECDEGGTPCVIWATRDVTTQRVQEEHLQQLQKLESLSVLAGGIARDFSNLSGALQRHLRLGRLGMAEGADPSHHFELAEGFALRAAELSRQLLAYSGQPTQQFEAFSLNALVEEAIAEVKEKRCRHAQLELALDQGLPQVHGDREQLQLCLSGILANACESMGERGGRVRVGTGATHLDAGALSLRMPGQEIGPGRYLWVEVEDEGSGMSPEILARIFDPFFTTKPTGRGLGLASLRGVLRAHRAGLEVDSEPGRGTRMTLHFPVAGS